MPKLGILNAHKNVDIGDKGIHLEGENLLSIWFAYKAGERVMSASKENIIVQQCQYVIGITALFL